MSGNALWGECQGNVQQHQSASFTPAKAAGLVIFLYLLFGIWQKLLYSECPYLRADPGKSSGLVLVLRGGGNLLSDLC